MNFSHVSVLLNESIDGLNINPHGIYVDCTAGGGGHSYEIAKKLDSDGLLIALDRDPDAIELKSMTVSPLMRRPRRKRAVI